MLTNFILLRAPAFGINTSETKSIKSSNHIIDKDYVIKSNDLRGPYYINITTLYIIKAFERKRKNNECMGIIPTSREIIIILLKLNLS